MGQIAESRRIPHLLRRAGFGGSPEEIASYALSPAIRVHFIEDGDHSLVPRKRSGRSEDEAREEALEEAKKFLLEL
jgi:predicted alpha/beta-hydrolase family hydrolase